MKFTMTKKWAKINKKSVKASGIKFFVKKDGKEVARAFLYVMNNGLKKEPFGFLEDLFVDETLRGQGIGTELLNMVIAEAKKLGCYKLIAKADMKEKVSTKCMKKLVLKDLRH